MADLKKHQPAMDVDSQIKNLKDLGLCINDVEFAKSVLNEVSYFRLIKAYSLQLKEKNSNFHSGISFEQILNLYRFNKRLRNLLYPLIEDIEIAFRCRISNFFGMKYGVTGYFDSNNFVDPNYHQEIIDEINNSISRNSMSPFVKNFRTNYEDGSLPIYAVCEIISFGTLSKFYKNMKADDKKAIATEFGTSYVYLESWMESIAHVRNICAHYGRLYNNKLTKTPKLYKQYIRMNDKRENNQKIRNNRLFGILLCMKYLENEKVWNEFIEELKSLFNIYSDVNISTMGFPADWEKLLAK